MRVVLDRYGLSELLAASENIDESRRRGEKNSVTADQQSINQNNEPDKA